MKNKFHVFFWFLKIFKEQVFGWLRLLLRQRKFVSWFRKTNIYQSLYCEIKIIKINAHLASNFTAAVFIVYLRAVYIVVGRAQLAVDYSAADPRLQFLFAGLSLVLIKLITGLKMNHIWCVLTWHDRLLWYFLTFAYVFGVVFVIETIRSKTILKRQICGVFCVKVAW